MNLVIGKIVDKKFRYIGEKKRKIEIKERDTDEIKKNVRGLMWHKIGSYVLNGTDNLVISYFVGIVAVGIYSNYILITRTLTQFMNQLFNAIVPAMGDIIAEDKVKGNQNAYHTYKMTYYVSFILFGTSTMILASLVQPFVKLWVGAGNLAPEFMVLCLVLNFYFTGMRIVPSTTKSAAGIYTQDRFSPICEAFINLIISILLVRRIGVSGVIIGTLLSNLMMPFWTAPYYLYRDLFHKRFLEYIISSVKYFLITLIGSILVFYLNHLNFYFSTSEILNFVLKCIFTGITSVIYMFVAVCLNKETGMLKPYINRFMKRKRTKNHKNKKLY